MATERDTRQTIRTILETAGYGLVVLDSRLGETNLRADAIGYAADAAGDLVPWVVVEVKNGANVTPDATLSHLLRARDVLGTVEHYAVLNGQWYRADRSLRSFDAVDVPIGPPNDAPGWITDPNLAASLLTNRLWHDADRARGKGGPDFFFPSTELFVETGVPGIETTQDAFVPVRPDVLWQARRRALASFTGRMRSAGEHSTATDIADAVARLLGNRLGGTVLDPFCGVGNFLWAAIERASGADGPTEFVGREINVELAELAGEVARTAPLFANVTAGDSFEDVLPTADCVVAAPPLGRVVRPWTLLDGTQARELEAAALDVCLRQLRPGGRAVLLLPTSITFKQNLESYRRHVATEFRVGALIGLPASALAPHTNLRAVLLVIDRAPAGPTFVAQLGEDWRSQLGPTGAAINAALEHLDRE